MRWWPWTATLVITAAAHAVDGDCNRDGWVNATDLLMVIADLGETVPEGEHWYTDCNGDGQVSVPDMFVVFNLWGEAQNAGYETEFILLRGKVYGWPWLVPVEESAGLIPGVRYLVMTPCYGTLELVAPWDFDGDGEADTRTIADPPACRVLHASNFEPDWHEWDFWWPW